MNDKNALSFFVTSSDPSFLLSVETSLKKFFPPCDVFPAKNCDEALSSLRSGKKFDGYIFDEEKCHHFDLLLEKVIDFGKPFISTSDLKMDLVSVKSNHKGITYTSVGRDLFMFPNDDYPFSETLRFIFLSPVFYFSYGNVRGEGIINLSREILLEIEDCMKSIFPSIETKKDFVDFNKGALHTNKREELISAPYIIIILSKEYFHSYHCMQELYLILESVNFDLDIFNQKICLIFSKNLKDLLDPMKLEHSKFISDLENYWMRQLEYFVQLYKGKVASLTYKEQVDTSLNILTHNIRFIEDEIHKILRGNESVISLENIKRAGYPDLMAEINNKLEDSFQTPYKHLSPASKNIIFSKKANKHIQYKKTFERYDEALLP